MNKKYQENPEKYKNKTRIYNSTNRDDVNSRARLAYYDLRAEYDAVVEVLGKTKQYKDAEKAAKQREYYRKNKTKCVDWARRYRLKKPNQTKDAARRTYHKLAAARQFVRQLTEGVTT